MRISDWSSDVCSSDLAWQTEDCPDGSSAYVEGLKRPGLASAAVVDGYRRCREGRSCCGRRIALLGARAERSAGTVGYSRFGQSAAASRSGRLRVEAFPWPAASRPAAHPRRPEEHTSDLQSLMRVP